MPAIWVEECAWHPKYIGHRKFTFRVPIPHGMTPHEFVQTAERKDRITHGICSDCKPIFQAEIRAMAKAHRQSNHRGYHRRQRR